MNRMSDLRKVFLVCVVFILSVLPLTGCQSRSSSLIVGKWQNVDDSNEVLTIGADGNSLSISGDIFYWEYKLSPTGKKLTVYNPLVEREYGIKFPENDRMVLTENDGEIIEYSRLLLEDVDPTDVIETSEVLPPVLETESTDETVEAVYNDIPDISTYKVGEVARIGSTAFMVAGWNWVGYSKYGDDVCPILSEPIRKSKLSVEIYSRYYGDPSFGVTGASFRDDTGVVYDAKSNYYLDGNELFPCAIPVGGDSSVYKAVRVPPGFPQIYHGFRVSSKDGNMWKWPEMENIRLVLDIQYKDKSGELMNGVLNFELGDTPVHFPVPDEFNPMLYLPDSSYDGLGQDTIIDVVSITPVEGNPGYNSYRLEIMLTNISETFRKFDYGFSYMDSSGGFFDKKFEEDVVSLSPGESILLSSTVDIKQQTPDPGEAILIFDRKGEHILIRLSNHLGGIAMRPRNNISVDPEYLSPVESSLPEMKTMTVSRDGSGYIVPYNACPRSGLLSRVIAGDTATVDKLGEVILYDKAKFDNLSVVAMAPYGGQLEIISGPVCQDDLVWWKVISSDNGFTGWVVESDPDLDYHFSPKPNLREAEFDMGISVSDITPSSD